MPFVVRGVKLWGMNSSGSSMKRREFAWNEAKNLIDFDKLKDLTQEHSLEDLINIYPKMLKGELFGRVVINPNK